MKAVEKGMSCIESSTYCCPSYDSDILDGQKLDVLVKRPIERNREVQSHPNLVAVLQVEFDFTFG